jgi:hypothetical protein
MFTGKPHTFELEENIQRETLQEELLTLGCGLFVEVCKEGRVFLVCCRLGVVY